MGWGGVGAFSRAFEYPLTAGFSTDFSAPFQKINFPVEGGGGLLDAYVKRKKLFSAKNRGGFVAVDRLDYQHRVTCPTISFHVLIKPRGPPSA